MPWEPLAEWGPLDSHFDELSPPSICTPYWETLDIELLFSLTSLNT